MVNVHMYIFTMELSLPRLLINLNMPIFPYIYVRAFHVFH